MTNIKDRSPAMQFYFRQFMGDDAVILMDLDAVGAHILLMCFAGSSPEGFRIQNRDEILQKILRGVGPSDWARIKPQIMAAWDISDDGKWIIQRGMQRTLLKQKEFSKKQKENIDKRWEDTKRDTKRVPDGIPNGYSSSTSSSSSSSTSKKKNNNKIITPKIQFGDFVYLTEDEHQKLLAKFDVSFVEACIEKLNAWIGCQPTPNRKTNGKNAACTFRSWVIGSVQKELASAKTHNKTHQEQILETMETIFNEVKAHEN